MQTMVFLSCKSLKALFRDTTILQRMRELAVQSANASNSSADRTSLQSEVTQLSAELDRIANTTSFGATKLLNGAFASKTFQVGAKVGETFQPVNLFCSIFGYGYHLHGCRPDDHCR